MKAWLRNAFAVESRQPLVLTDDQREMVERVAREVIRRKLGTPALAFLEMSHPLNAVGANAVHFFTPLLSVLYDVEGCRRFAEFLERRGSIEAICRRIEELLQVPPPAAPR